MQSVLYANDYNAALSNPSDHTTHRGDASVFSLFVSFERPLGGVATKGILECLRVEHLGLLCAATATATAHNGRCRGN